MATSNQKLKLLHLARILHEDTDDQHGLTMPQIVEKLADLGIDAERKALYRDIASLEEFGFCIEKLRTSPVQYALVSRRFEEGELLLLADAIQSSKFLTKTKSEKLTRSIKTLGSKRQAKSLAKHLHVEGRIKMQNESVFYSLDAIQQAIAAKRKVEFQYFKYDCNKNRTVQHDGRIYKETPVQMVYSGDCYYLVTFNDKHSSFVSYRVDRMLQVTVSQESATRNADIATFDMNAYQARLFGMFSGEAVRAQLLVAEDAMGAVIDRFGRDVKSLPTGDGFARVNVTVTESPTFFGWVAQFGTLVKIEQPASLKAAYVKHLQDILEDC